MATPIPAKKSPGKAKAGSSAKSASKAATKAKSVTSRTAKAKPIDQLRIRMYRLGIGDCFLLTLPGETGKPFHLLIDCGTHSSERGGPKNNRDPWRTEAAAADILEVTGGRLNAVVGTHEHWDHLSGFLQGKQFFEKCEAEVIWCSWAENQKNEPIAQELVGLRRDGEQALWKIRQQIQAPPLKTRQRPQVCATGFLRF